MSDEEIIKIRFVETKYKQFSFVDPEDEAEEIPGVEEPNWKAMGLTPQGKPLEEEEAFEEDEMYDKLVFDWMPITVDITQVWAVSGYDTETIIWVGGKSLSIQMTIEEALEKFHYAKLHI